ncbi:DUF3108 domain-containing protein [Arenimonas sp. MALMAid1274]|uniref:DUF3108 domain-containing protein n=1 Tax=Arenimonas sp. MALMAid1274 TaxID=3411630 RepID=UPI003B9E67F1
MRTLILALSLLLPASAAIAAAPPQAFSADYDVFQNDKKLGSGSIVLRSLGGGRWEMQTRTGATQGLYAAAGARRDERSVLSWSGPAPETVEYRMQQKAAWSERKLDLVVSAAQRSANSTYKGETTQIPYRPGLLDKHGLTAAIMSDLAAGVTEGQELSYYVADRRDAETQRYRVADNVRLQTAIGVQRAVRVERIRDDGNGRVTKIWFARERGWLPLRIKQYESDGETLDMRITAIR